MILVDTSVWINHLRTTDDRLTALLDAGQILGHPFVTGEIALGDLRHRVLRAAMLRRLPQEPSRRIKRCSNLIERRALFGRGIGYVDAHLLAAVRLTSEARVVDRRPALAISRRRTRSGHRSVALTLLLRSCYLLPSGLCGECAMSGCHDETRAGRPRGIAVGGEGGDGKAQRRGRGAPHLAAHPGQRAGAARRGFTTAGSKPAGRSPPGGSAPTR